MSQQWVLLWSQRQNSIHIQPLEECLSKNRQAYKDNRPPDYVPLFVGERAPVTAAASHCSGTLLDRELELGLTPLAPTYLPETSA